MSPWLRGFACATPRPAERGGDVALAVPVFGRLSRVRSKPPLGCVARPCSPARRKRASSVDGFSCLSARTNGRPPVNGVVCRRVSWAHERSPTTLRWTHSAPSDGRRDGRCSWVHWGGEPGTAWLPRACAQGMSRSLGAGLAAPRREGTRRPVHTRDTVRSTSARAGL